MAVRLHDSRVFAIDVVVTAGRLDQRQRHLYHLNRLARTLAITEVRVANRLCLSVELIDRTVSAHMPSRHPNIPPHPPPHSPPNHRWA